MRRSHTIALLIAIVWLAGTPLTFAEKTDGKVLLQNKFKEGETVYLSMQATAKGSLQMSKNDGQPSTGPIDDAIDTVASFKTTAAGESGWASILVRFERLVMSSAGFGGQSQDLLKRLKLDQETATFQIDRAGDMKLPDSDQAGGSMLNDTIRSTTRQSPYLTLPPAAVAVGTTWTEKKQVPFVGVARPIIANSTYTLDGITERNGEKIATIKSETTIHSMNIPIDSITPGQTKSQSIVIRYLLKEYTSTGNGTIEFSLDRGQILSFKTVQQIVRHMAGDSDIDKATFKGDSIQKFTQTTEGAYSTEKPVFEEKKPEGESSSNSQ